MSLKPRFLSENFYNDVQFTSHVLAANEAASGNEVWRVGTGRRAGDRNKWTPTTPNNVAWVKVTCDRVRQADTIVLDRGHNLGGYTVELHVSNDNFSTYTTCFSTVLPTLVYPNAHLDQLPGVRMPNGEWAFYFGVYAGMYWRLYVPAMGASLRPEVVGLYLGKSYEPDYHLDLPIEDEGGDSFFDDVMSNTAWVASTRAAHRRSGTIRMRLSSTDEYEKARYHIRKTFMEDRRLMWMWFNQEQAERGVLARHNSGRYSFPKRSGWFHRQTEFDWFEHEPALT